MSLPAEIWTRIFDLAADDDILFRPGFPSSLAESAWYKDYWNIYVDQGHGNSASEWRLTSPQQAMDILQRRSYATKKVFFFSWATTFDIDTLLLHRQLSPPVDDGDRLDSSPSFGVCISAMRPRLSV